MQNDSFDELMAEIENKDTLESETVGNQWGDGDTCGEKGCTCKVQRRDHPRDSQLGTDPHRDAPETEFVCRFHGVVGKR